MIKISIKAARVNAGYTLEPSRHIPEREEVRLMDIPFAQRFLEVQRLKKLPRK